ncbi:phosphatidylinositol 3-kinase [Pelomyxa schiedti]|nr:phosphatidylinositol 3-kinase [Pelomyxa schiedti]
MPNIVVIVGPLMFFFTYAIMCNDGGLTLVGQGELEGVETRVEVNDRSAVDNVKQAFKKILPKLSNYASKDITLGLTLSENDLLKVDFQRFTTAHPHIAAQYKSNPKQPIHIHIFLPEELKWGRMKSDSPRVSTTSPRVSTTSPRVSTTTTTIPATTTSTVIGDVPAITTTTITIITTTTPLKSLAPVKPSPPVPFSKTLPSPTRVSQWQSSAPATNTQVQSPSQRILLPARVPSQARPSQHLPTQVERVEPTRCAPPSIQGRPQPPIPARPSQKNSPQPQNQMLHPTYSSPQTRQSSTTVFTQSPYFQQVQESPHPELQPAETSQTLDMELALHLPFSEIRCSVDESTTNSHETNRDTGFSNQEPYDFGFSTSDIEPSIDPQPVFTSKLLEKSTGAEEGDTCPAPRPMATAVTTFKEGKIRSKYRDSVKAVMGFLRAASTMTPDPPKPATPESTQFPPLPSHAPPPVPSASSTIVSTTAFETPPETSAFTWENIPVISVEVPSDGETTAFPCIDVHQDSETMFFQTQIRRYITEELSRRPPDIRGSTLVVSGVDTSKLPAIFPDVYPVMFYFPVVSNQPPVERMCFGDQSAHMHLRNALIQAKLYPTYEPDDLALRIHGTREYILDKSNILRNYEYAEAPQLDFPKVTTSVQRCLPLSLITKEFSVKILGITNFDPKVLSPPFEIKESLETSGILFRVDVTLQYGTNKLNGTALQTGEKPTTCWFEWIMSGLPYNSLPLETCLLFTVTATFRRQTVCLGWSTISLFDHHGMVRQGYFTLGLWSEKVISLPGMLPQNLNVAALSLGIQLEKHPLQIYADQPNTFDPPSNPTSLLSQAHVPTAIELEALQQIIFHNRTHPLDDDLSLEQKQLVWSLRRHMRHHYPSTLPLVLRCADWRIPSCRHEALTLLESWGSLRPMDSLNLLDRTFPDRGIREYSVRCLSALSDDELSDVLLPLVQAIKFELYHYNALVRFLVMRGLRNKLMIGSALFWYLQSELHLDEFQTRYGLIVSAYEKTELSLQATFVHQLEKAKAKINDDPERALATHLANLKVFEQTFSLPSSPKIITHGAVLDKCHSMSSHQAPLWIVLKNADPCPAPNVAVIFKSGDDLRQDCLTLHALNIMDKIWKEAGLDLRLSIYKVIPTGASSGFIEVVPDAATTAKIQKQVVGVTGALRKTPLLTWMEQSHPDKKEYDMAVENFVYSCAGYCVATYILGIGDRHNDNIMVDKSGHLFHIDFAHILGNIIKFGPYDREKAPFVLTPEFVHFMGGLESENFATFVKTCCKAYNLLRADAHIFFDLFKLMIHMGVPQLNGKEDLTHMLNAFSLELSEQDAAHKFTLLITQSINCTTTLINFLTHNIVHWNA